MKKLRAFCLFILLCLMLPSAAAVDSMTVCSVQDTLPGKYSLSRLPDNTTQVFDYDIPENGVTMLVLFSSTCNFSARFLNQLSVSGWLNNPRVNACVVDCSDSDFDTTQAFLSSKMGVNASRVSAWNGGGTMLWDYVDALTGEGSVTFPVVMLVAGNESARTIRAYSIGYQTRTVVETSLNALLEQLEQETPDLPDVPSPPVSTTKFTYYVDEKGGALITGASDCEPDLVIPSSIDGYPVTGIRSQAFYGNNSLESVVIPEGVTHLGSKAFQFCENLRHVTLPASVTSIQGNIFVGCKKLSCVEVPTHSTFLKSVDGVLFSEGGSKLVCYPSGRAGTHYTLPEGVTSLENSAFYECGLSDLTLPASLKTFTKASVFRCMDLQNFQISPNNPYFTARDGLLYSQDMAVCLACPSGRPGTVTVADGVTEIADYAFQNCGYLTRAVLPDSVRSIGTLAFEQCLVLSRLDLPADLTAIGSEAFQFCLKLASLTFPASLETIGASAFSNTALIECLFAGDAPEIAGGVNPFPASIALYRLPNSSGWDTAVWNGHTFLTWDGSTLPEVSGIAYRSSDGSPWRLDRNTGTLYFSGSTLYSPGMYLSGSWRPYLPWVKNIIIGNTTTRLEAAAFSEYFDLDSLHISASVDVITDTVFNDCPKIETISVDPASTRFYTQDGMLLTLDHYLLYAGNMEDMTSFTLPDHIRGIGHFAFLNTRFESLGLPKSLDSSFMGLRLPTLKHISIPSGGRYTVADDILYDSRLETVVFCPNGKTGTVTLPSTVRVINTNAFQYSGLSEVVIPEGCSSVLRNAFFGSALETLHIPSTLTNIQLYAFGECASLRSVTFEPGLRILRSSTFNSCTALEEVNLPSTLTTLENAVFSHCAALKEITLPEHVTAIGNYTFDGCASLERVYFPSGLTTIGVSTFSDCTALTTVDLGDSLTNLPSYTFDGCRALESLTLPGSLIQIEDSAFRYCYELRALYFPGTSAAATDLVFDNCGDDRPTIYHRRGDPMWNFPLGEYLGCPLADWELPESAFARLTDEGLEIEFSGVCAPSPFLVAFYDSAGRMRSCREFTMEHGRLAPIPLPRNACTAKVFFLADNAAPLRDALTAG